MSLPTARVPTNAIDKLAPMGLHRGRLYRTGSATGRRWSATSRLASIGATPPLSGSIGSSPPRTPASSSVNSTRQWINDRVLVWLCRPSYGRLAFDSSKSSIDSRGPTPGSGTKPVHSRSTFPPLLGDPNTSRARGQLGLSGDRQLPHGLVKRVASPQGA